jgi:hypothetical protein
MSDNPNVDDQNPNGAGGVTNPSVSQGEGKSVADAGNLSKLVRDAIAEELKPIKGEIGGLYSRQDKDRNAMREFMGEVKKQQANGLSENDAIDAAESTLKERAETQAEKKMLKDIHAKLFGEPSANPAGNGSNGVGDSAKVVSELKLDGNSAEVISIISKGLDPVMEELELRRLADRPKSTPSLSAAPAGSVPAAQQASGKELENNYKKEMRESAGRQNANKRQEIKERYLKEGVDVHNIDFG